MIVVVFFAFVHVCASVPMIHNILDPQLMSIDDVDGFLYELPDYEDPLLVQHQLSSIGAMPIFTLMESAKKRGISKIDDAPEKVKIAESRKALDEALSRIEYALSKLEKGNGNIYTDVEKAIQILKTLENNIRLPDVRQVLSSLQSRLSLPRPIDIPSLKRLLPTSIPDLFDRSSVIEKPQSYDKEALSIRVISSYKPESGESHVLENPLKSIQKPSTEKSFDVENVRNSFENINDKKSFGKVNVKKSLEDEKRSFEDVNDKKSFEDGDDKKSFEDVNEKKSFEDVNEKKSFEDVNEKKSFEDVNEKKSFEEVNEKKSFEDVNDQKSLEDGNERRPFTDDTQIVLEKPLEPVESLKDNFEATKSPFEMKINEKKNAKFNGDDSMGSYKAKITWKAAGIV